MSVDFPIRFVTSKERKLTLGRLAVSRRVVVSRAVVGLIVAIGLLWAYSHRQHRRALNLLPLAAALDRLPYRRIEPRLSLPVTCHPRRPASRGEAEAAGGLLQAPVLAAAANILANSPAGQDDQHAQGLAYLATGQVSQALRTLRAATTSSPDAGTWSDYAAALLASSEQNDDPLLAIDALAACDAALAIDRNRPEARFNRALALGSIGLLTEAHDEFHEYLRVDRQSTWAVEATRHAALLRPVNQADQWKAEVKPLLTVFPADATVDRLVRQYPQEARTYTEGVWLSDWADAFHRHDEKQAAERLALARQFATALQKSSGESLTADAVAAIDRATAQGDRKRIDLLATAYQTYRDGRIAYSQNHVADGEAALRRADEMFTSAGSPMAYVARYYIASTLFGQSRLNSASPMLDELASMHLDRRGYRALAAQVGWERGLTAVMRGSFSEGYGILQESRDTLRALGETTNEAALDALLATTEDQVRNPLLAWRSRRRSLASLARIGRIDRKIVTVESGATSCAARQEWTRALALLHVTETAAADSHMADVAAHACTECAIIEANLGANDAARSELAKSRRWIAAIGDVPLKRRAEADAAYAEGLILTAESPAAALERFAAALAFLHDADYRLDIPRIYLARGRALRRMKDIAGARKELDLGLDELERQRGLLSDLEQRATMFAAAQELFDDAIVLAVESRDIRGALHLAERQRARALFDRFSSADRGHVAASRKPMDPKEIEQSLAADSLLVEYAATPDQLIVFTVRAGNIGMLTRPLNRTQVAQLVTAYRQAVVARNASAFADVSRSLAEILIEPIRDSLPGVRQIAFVPDRWLSSISFATLPIGSAALIDEMSVVQSPSATMAIECSRRAGERQPESLLAVSGSAFDRSRYGDLSSLLAVDREAVAAAALHPRSMALVAEGATPAAVAREMGRFDIVHFATHAVYDPENPLDSSLLLAPERTGHGELHAADIAALTLPHTQLVVLAACGTADSKGGGDGAVNLAAAFLEAGVPTVVATMWSAEDTVTADFMRRLHRQLPHWDTAAAFRDALRQMSDSKEPGRYPIALGGISVIGGSRDLVRPPRRRR